jgi:hypothetical protein
MFRMFARVTIGSLAFAAMLGGIRAAGSLSRPPALVELDPGSCTQPCWHGIRPGLMTFTEAERILRADNTLRITARPGKTLCWTSGNEPPWHGCIRKWSPGNAVEDMTLYLPDNVLLLGDAITLFGTPHRVRLCWVTGYSSVFVMATLSFGNHVEITAYNPRHPLRLKLDPAMSVSQIFYLIGDSPHLDSRSLDWRGFIAMPQKGCGEQ